MLHEISLRKDYTGESVAETIYFGGGTPSLLSEAELATILDQLRSQFSIADDAEITLEANPDDISPASLNAWKKIGINRLSIGVQSFFEEDLVWMNRAHNARQAEESLGMATRLFDNITIDLIYGVPGLSDERWEQNVKKAIAFNIPHLSCYALTVEPRTPLDKMIRNYQSRDVDTDQQAAQFLLLMQWMEEGGYEHYEISNFARPGFRSRHNTAYWQAGEGKTYTGFGPSAHSFNGKERQWNVSNNITYIREIGKDEVPAEKEVLTPVQQLNEYIMTSLRTMEGVDLTFIETQFSIPAEKLLAVANKFLQNNLITLKGKRLVLTRDGKLLADGIAAELFFD